MKPSSTRDVRTMYESTAESYAEMMDREIQDPVYADVHGRLQERIAGAPGMLLDTACGSGHMLDMFREHFDRRRPLAGVDLSPRMVDITSRRLGAGPHIVVADMRDMPMFEADAAAAILNFYALHHLDEEGVRAAAVEWHRILHPGGQLVVASWEGEGLIDYGEEADIVALRHTQATLQSIFEDGGFAVQRCVVLPVEGFPMDAVYLECGKAACAEKDDGSR